MAKSRGKSSKAGSGGGADAAKMSYEDAIAELEAITERIERGEIGLEDSLAEYKRGLALVKRCRDVLDVAEQEIKKIKPDEIVGRSDR